MIEQIDGRRITRSFDSEDNLIQEIREGTSGGAYPDQVDRTTTYTRDGLGNVLTQITTAGALALTNTVNQYDMAGRLTNTVDIAGLVTTYAYTDGGRITTVTRPGGASEITENYLDGRLKSFTGTSVIHRYFEYGVNTDGSQWTQTYAGPLGTNSPSWTKNTTDMLGRTVETTDFGSAVSSFEYNDLGQLIISTRTGAADTLYEYDLLGRQDRFGLDVNDNGSLDLASLDRISENNTVFVEIGSDWYQETLSIVYAADNNGTPTTVSTQRKKLNGSGCGCAAGESEFEDILGNLTVTTTAVDPVTKTVTRTTDVPDSTQNVSSVTVNGLLMEQTSKTGVTTTFAYDDLGRRIYSGGATTPSRKTGTTIAYNALGQIASTTDGATNTTTFVYEANTGRRIETVDALSNSTHTAYNDQGQVTNTWGATYPVSYEYDDSGRMVTMNTWRDDSGSSDSTQWHYDPATGLLTNKLDAAGQGASYEYDSAGRLTQRTWARGEATDYYYDTLGQLTNINYSTTNTPDIAFSYDRLGRQKTITDAQGTRTHAYSTNTLQLLSETLITLDGQTNFLTRSTDSLGRQLGLAVPSEPGGYDVTYGYNSMGQFHSISSSVQSVSSVVNYSYLQNSDLLQSTTLEGNAPSLPLTITRTYENNRDLLDSIANADTNGVISKYDYSTDALGRRASVDKTGSAFTTPDLITYGYNSRSEVTSANSLSNLLYAYVFNYDDIGNRELASTTTQTNSYEVNELNQYTNLTDGGASSTLTYDSDGNLLSDGTWTYIWNSENRLILASNASTVVENTYDYQGRRIMKTANGVTNRFLYDGWNMIHEKTGGATTPSRSYVWGLDLSQTLQGAGGVGGLLSAHTTNSTHIATFDGNGNVSEYIDSSDGSIAAHYEYDPFGNITAQTGVNPNDFAYRFSTKYLDGETDLYYYGFRYYSPELGRWVSRDRVIELSFRLIQIERDQPFGLNLLDTLDYRLSINLQAFVYNSPIRLFDPTGLCPPLILYGGWTLGQWIFAGIAGGVILWTATDTGQDTIQNMMQDCYSCVRDGIPYVVPKTRTRRRSGCRPCPPPPAIPPQPPRTDLVPPGRPHYPCPGNHTHIYYWEVNQEPFPSCLCHNNAREQVICL